MLLCSSKRTRMHRHPTHPRIHTDTPDARGGGSYKAGGVHLLPSDQAGDVFVVVDDALHAAHKVVPAP